MVEYNQLTETLYFSLPKWIAYWTCGFEMAVQWYYRRICRTLTAISAASKRVLPLNRRTIGDFMGCWGMVRTEILLSGLRDVDQWEYFDWNHDRVFGKFTPWLFSTEDQLRTFLRKITYVIDAENTLTVAMGSGRPEQVRDVIILEGHFSSNSFAVCPPHLVYTPGTGSVRCEQSKGGCPSS